MQNVPTVEMNEQQLNNMGNNKKQKNNEIVENKNDTKLAFCG